MLRILYCTDSLTAGGIESQLTELTIRLDRTRFEPHIICLYSERAGRSRHFLPRLQAAGISVQVLDLGWSAADKLRGWLSIIRATWQLRPHILYAANYHSNLLTSLARPFLPPGTRLIGSVETVYTPRQIFYERLSWWLCAAIICNSPHLQRQLIGAGIPITRVTHIPNGVDTSRFGAIPAPERTQALRARATRVLAMFARVSEQKSPHLLAQAVGRLKRANQLPPGTRVLLIGERENEAVQVRLDQAVAQDDLAGVFQLHAPTDCPEAYYHAADVTVLASLWEGLPNVVLESLAAGRPVVISEAANATGVIEHGITGWVVRTGDVAHLAEILAVVLSLPNVELDAMRAACVRKAEEYAMPHLLNRHQALYEQICAPIPHR
jgi:glycosyltransferase involved in cell wall biosynthesis